MPEGPETPESKGKRPPLVKEEIWIMRTKISFLLKRKEDSKFITVKEMLIKVNRGFRGHSVKLEK